MDQTHGYSRGNNVFICWPIEAKSDYLGPLILTPEIVAMKIKAMKNIKSPGVDGIPPKLVMETAEQISIPLARVFNSSLEEGVVPFEWK